jgi:uncharacterized protein YndB with AHSA1/START domain
MPIDVAGQLGAVQREVRTVEQDGGTARVVIAEQTYPTGIEDLWDALTSPVRIPRWFLPISGDLRLGGQYQFEGNAGGEIRTCERPRLLAVGWDNGGMSSDVVVRLTAVDEESTHLELEHTAAVPDEFWDQYGPGAVGVGWDMALMGLAEHVSHPDSAVVHDDAIAWMVSPDGQRFVNGSNDSWADASVAAGTDESAAREAAVRTLAFYTGAPEGEPAGQSAG